MKLPALLLAFLFTACSSEKKEPQPDSKTVPEPTTEAAKASSLVRLETDHGPIVIKLDPGKAPITCSNFVQYVSDGHYDGTAFHRVIKGFMIQGGGFVPEEGRLVEKTTRDPIANEGRNGLRNLRGTIAMARTGDPDSATAQFFINHKDNVGLDYPNPDGHGYAVFGEVVEGMETVDKIAELPTDYGKLAMTHPSGGGLNESNAPDVPKEPVVIRSAKIVEKTEE